MGERWREGRGTCVPAWPQPSVQDGNARARAMCAGLKGSTKNATACHSQGRSRVSAWLQPSVQDGTPQPGSYVPASGATPSTTVATASAAAWLQPSVQDWLPQPAPPSWLQPSVQWNATAKACQSHVWQPANVAIAPVPTWLQPLVQDWQCHTWHPQEQHEMMGAKTKPHNTPYHIILHHGVCRDEPGWEKKFGVSSATSYMNA